MKANKPRILLLDVETVPGKGYVWSLKDRYMPLERLIEPGRMVTLAYKWYGERGVTFLAEWQPNGRRFMLEKLRDALDSADAVVTYNGDGFDFPTILTEFIKDGVKPPAPITSIDLYKRVVQKARFMSGKLAYVAPLLEMGKKLKHEGFALWRKVMAGDEKARLRMERYNKQDVRLLGTGYRRLRPYITDHPHLHNVPGTACPTCGSKHVQHRGYRRTRTYKIERYQCQADSCGAWFSGKKTKA